MIGFIIKITENGYLVKTEEGNIPATSVFELNHWDQVDVKDGVAYLVKGGVIPVPSNTPA